MSGLRAEKSGFYNKAGGEIFLLSTLQKHKELFMNSNGAMGFLTAYIISIRHFWSSFNNDNGNNIYNDNDIV